MSSPNPGKLALLLVGLILAGALPVLLKGGLFITNYEGDALHLADIALRMAAGERAHLDFMTPLGALAFWPFVPALRMGADLGLAFVTGQVLFALAAAVPIGWAAWTRLPARLGYGFAAISALLLTSLSHGAAGSVVAVSMHYNRWAWVVSFAAVVVAVLPPRGRARPWIDGAVLAGCMAVLAFLKATYVVAFAPALVLILLVRRDWPLLLAAAVTGVALAAILTAILGPAAILAYLGDLQAVAQGTVRKAPGYELHTLVISPAYFVGVATALAGVMVLRRGGAAAEGLSILILIPAFLYVTWQNYGNDPVWLILLWVLLFALRPARSEGTPPGKDPSVGVGLAGFAAFVLSVPLMQNHAVSGLRLILLDGSRYVPMVPERAGLGDIYNAQVPADLVRSEETLTDPGRPYSALGGRVPAYAPVEFRGEMLPNCKITLGIQASLATIAEDLAPEERGRVFVADLISSHWLYAGGTPLPSGAPWNYGTLSGLDRAEFVLVPLCPIGLAARNAIVKLLEEDGRALTLARETPFYRLYRVGG